MVIAKEGFQDDEFKFPKGIIEDAGFLVDVSSTEKGECKGKFGSKVVADLDFDEVETSDYVAVVLVGGPGSKELVGNRSLERILNEATVRDLLIGAICFSPVILAKAGIINGRKATVFDVDGSNINVINEDGVYVDEDVVVDGKLVTANGPKAAKEFGEKLVGFLDGN